jgi:nucleoside-diphosphate-sugar epimerase
MKVIDKSKPVLVTGGSGYMASWIIKMLLEDGISVNATVRDPLDEKKINHLTAMAKGSPGKLKFFKADLLDSGSFDEAMRGCELVIHTASPFFLTHTNNPEKELLKPALEGTRNVLETAKRNSSVKRVVLTSSVVAIFGDNADLKFTPGGVFNENGWNQTSSAGHQPYPYSKTIAEKEAWIIAKEQDQWDLVTLNPGWILGPSLSKRVDSLSISMMIQFGNGTYKMGGPKILNGIVDVRDVASAHIKAGFTPTASGRHILVSGVASLLDLADILRKYFGEAYPFPGREVPKFIFWILAPMFGFTRKYVSRNVGFPVRFDNSYSKEDLGMKYIPVEQTVKDHFQQILDDKLLDKSAL